MLAIFGLVLSVLSFGLSCFALGVVWGRLQERKCLNREAQD